ncbi:hypothetical protein E3Q17_03256 [Wallemia mellicola]|uniref:Large ribosomal subunit protein bL32m n=1 Tax=Wallemia mellicola TaxID=1708541 RepID=A0A4T0NKW5_9BASI|nr:hypothetical protein E3Q17_03256 [Wallemia mellicola]
MLSLRINNFITGNLFEDLLGSILRAVPKKKVSHSRKAMRSANKGLRDKNNLVHCPASGLPKPAHHLSQELYNQLKRNWKSSQN